MYKLKPNFKLFFLIKAILICLFFSLKAYSDDIKDSKDLIVLGSNDATVKIKIFSSLTCPHCAKFHMNIVPAIEKEYIESGKVQLIFIDFPLDQAAFNASKLLQCSNQNSQLKLMDQIYQKQAEWTIGSTIDDVNKNLKKIAKDLGISSSDFEKCLINEDISDKILNGRIDAHRKYSINSTPTIIINEKKLEGSASFKNIKKKIEKII
jgi:protein-disulfide isomerase